MISYGIHHKACVFTALLICLYHQHSVTRRGDRIRLLQFWTWKESLKLFNSNTHLLLASSPGHFLANAYRVCTWTGTVMGKNSPGSTYELFRYCCLVAKSYLTLHKAGILEWGAISFSRGSSWPRDQTHFSSIWADKANYIEASPGSSFISPDLLWSELNPGFEYVKLMSAPAPLIQVSCSRNICFMDRKCFWKRNF